jgi:hypothetical protein
MRLRCGGAGAARRAHDSLRVQMRHRAADLLEQLPHVRFLVVLRPLLEKTPEIAQFRPLEHDVKLVAVDEAAEMWDVRCEV